MAPFSSYTTCTLAIVNFFSNIQYFSLQRPAVPPSSYVAFLKASITFLNFNFDNMVIISSPLVELGVFVKYGSLFGAACSFLLHQCFNDKLATTEVH